MGALFTGLFDQATLIPRLARGLSLGAAAAVAASAVPGASWGTIGSAFGLAFLGGVIGAGQLNTTK